MGQALHQLKVFISRRTEDQLIAEYLRSKLTEACGTEDRLEIFHAEHIPGGTEWKRWIDAKCREANCFLLIFRGPPEKWLTYELAKFEEDEAQERVIAIHPPGCRPDWLGEKQCYEARPEVVKRLFTEIIKEGTPDRGDDDLARFVALNESWTDDQIDDLVSGFLQLFGSQEEATYPLAIRITMPASDPLGDTDAVAPAEDRSGNGSSAIPDDAVVESIGPDNALTLFNRGGARTSTWADLTAWHRTGVDADASTAASMASAIARKWIGELDEAVARIKSERNMQQPRRTLRAYEGGGLYLPVVIRSKVSRVGREVVVESVDVALISLPRPTASDGRRFRLLDMLERIRNEVIKPLADDREWLQRNERARQQAATGALNLIRNEHPRETTADPRTLRDVFADRGVAIEQHLSSVYEAHDRLKEAVDDEDEATAWDALTTIERHSYEAWEAIVDDYQSVIHKLDHLIPAVSGGSAPTT